jgi:hypothetical protein
MRGTDRHMATTTRPVPPCLACDDAPGHSTTCAALNPETTFYLREPITGGHRDWTPAGIRYTGTTARREAVRALLPAMHWTRMIGKPELPMSPGLLINEILAGLGTAARHTTRIGYSSGACLHTMDCDCDPWRCHHRDEPGQHPYELLDLTVVAVELRYADRWQTFWFIDIGTGAVCLAIDDIPEATLPGVSRACQRRWCDQCPGSTRHPDSDTLRLPCPCPCPCHTRTAS